MDENEKRIITLAREVLRLSRNTLLVNLRFLDAALSRLEPKEIAELSFATDGRVLAYDPRHVLKCYRDDRAAPVRDYLHIVMHCIFRHMFINTLVDRPAWDLACDIAVEYSISQLNLKAAAATRSGMQTKEFARLQKEVGKLTAEKLYRFFLDEKLSPAKLAALRGLFYADDHELWYMSEEEKQAQNTLSPDGEDEEQKNHGQGESEETYAEMNAAVTADGEEETGGEGDAPPIGSEEDWTKVSEQIQMDMETFSKEQGQNAGAMLQNLREVNREKYDYAEFLKRFAVRGEVMRINDDEFDYVYYTYGLRLFRKMPLVEPLEYKEVKRIREFVVAIDTSGSVEGDTVQTFVQKTWNILKQSESYFKKINLHIIQCDASIQEDAKVTSQEEFDEYIRTMKIRGLGGTDFRPVFRYVDELLNAKELRNLKGLIYFTDGRGTFPEKKPDYETAFVFLDNEDNNYDVPPWAIRLVLRREDLQG